MDCLFHRLLSNVCKGFSDPALFFWRLSDRVYNGQRNSEGAGRELCVVQAVLTHGVVALYAYPFTNSPSVAIIFNNIFTSCSTATWTLHFQIYLDLYSATHEGSWLAIHRRKVIGAVSDYPFVFAYYKADTILNRKDAYCTLSRLPHFYILVHCCERASPRDYYLWRSLLLFYWLQANVGVWFLSPYC